LVQSGQFFPNNRVKMMYVGVDGQLGRAIDWTLRLSFSQNYGTYNDPYDPPADQFSALATVNWQLPRLAGTQLTASLATDQGQLLANTVGGFVGLRKQW
jgi:hypothetical protein